MREHHAYCPQSLPYYYCRLPASHLAISAHPESGSLFYCAPISTTVVETGEGLRSGSGVKLCATLKSDLGFLGSQSPKSLGRRFRAHPFARVLLNLRQTLECLCTVLYERGSPWGAPKQTFYTISPPLIH